jgi:uncharacterized protein with GYD domain
MIKYLSYGNYLGDGLKGLLNEGGSSRVAALKKACESVGGTIEKFYYAFGEYDFFAISNFPDNVSASAAALAMRATGLVSIKATVLMTPEEMDEVAKKAPAYRGPGQ